MRLNEAGIDLIKSFEGCKLEAYKDGGGILTIGYGHTGKEVVEGLKIDQDAANSILEKDLARFCAGVDSLLSNKNITDNQFSAMVAFAFNVGLNNFKFSTLLRCVNRFNLEAAANEFLRWDKDNGRVIAGLTRRRESERALFKA